MIWYPWLPEEIFIFLWKNKIKKFHENFIKYFYEKMIKIFYKNIYENFMKFSIKFLLKFSVEFLVPVCVCQCPLWVGLRFFGVIEWLLREENFVINSHRMLNFDILWPVLVLSRTDSWTHYMFFLRGGGGDSYQKINRRTFFL